MGDNAEKFNERVNNLRKEGKFVELINLCESTFTELKGETQEEREILAIAYLTKGNLFVVNEDFVTAAEYYTKAIEYNPDDAMTYANRGSAKDNLGQHIEAIEDFDKAIELNPDCEAWYYIRGNANVGLRQYDKAIEDYTRAIELEPNYTSAYYNRGRTEQELGLYNEAINDFTKTIDLNPNHLNAYYNRGYIQIHLEQYTKAIDDYSKVIELNPDDAGAYYNRGDAKKRLGQYAEAIEDFNIVVEKSKNSELVKSAKENLDRLESLMSIRPNAKEYTEQKISFLSFNVSEADREFISGLADQIWLKSIYIALWEYSTNEQNYKFLTELILDEIFLHFVNLKEANFPRENYNRILSEALWSTVHVAAGDLINNTDFNKIKNRAHEAGLSYFLREARTLLDENLITQENYDKLLEIPELKEYQAKYDKEMSESIDQLQKNLSNPFVIVETLIMHVVVYPILRTLKNISKELKKKD